MTLAADVLIVGAGAAGAALAYECALAGARVRVLERGPEPAEAGATRWSAAGLFWFAASTDELRLLSRDGLARHRTLSDELDADTGYRPAPMLGLAQSEAGIERFRPLIEAGVAAGFRGRLVSADEVYRLEPSLAPDVAVGGALCEQAHVEPALLTRAWLTAAERLGAEIRHGVDVQALKLEGSRCTAVVADGETLAADQIVITAGAWTRPLLLAAGIDLPVLHTHAEILESGPLAPVLSHLVLSAEPARAELEARIGSPETRPVWDTGTTEEIAPAAAELMLAQFGDGRLHLGQVSRAIPGFLGGPKPEGEALLRAHVRRFFPTLADTPATLHGRPVAISADRLPIAGPLPTIPNLHVISGLTSPLIYLPALAQRYAALLAGATPPELSPFSPGRFAA